MTIRQFQMLGTISQQGGLSVAEALSFAQTTFGSVCYQKWVIFNPARQEFILSREGSEALSAGRNIDLSRKHNTGHFSSRVPTRARDEHGKVISIKRVLAA